MIHHPIHPFDSSHLIHPSAPGMPAEKQYHMQYLGLLKLKPFRKEMTGSFLGSWSER